MPYANLIVNLYNIMEPEEHIYTFGIDHYIETIFPLDRPLDRIKRRKILLKYPGLKTMQNHYEAYLKLPIKPKFKQ